MNKQQFVRTKFAKPVIADSFADLSPSEKRKFKRLIGKKPVLEKQNMAGTKRQHEYRRFDVPKDIEGVAYVSPEEEMSLDDVDDNLMNGDLNKDHVPTYEELMRYAVLNPLFTTKALVQRDLGEFIKYFWTVLAHEELVWNWHMDYICQELMEIARRVSQGLPNLHDTIINVPPGTSKTSIVSIMFPCWCWTNWPWMRFICVSYSADLSLESADFCREIIRSQRFRQLFQEISIKEDKDTKSNFRIQYYDKSGVIHLGGNRYSTSVGGTVTGFHSHISIVDDPLKPDEEASEPVLKKTNHFISQTLSTRKVDKVVSTTVMIMQRLSQLDPTGYWLDTRKDINHISLPGEIRNFAQFVKPSHLKSKYVNDLLDINRLPWVALNGMEEELGPYGYAGQVGQNPVPPGGGMFKADRFEIIDQMPTRSNIISTVRYWDKAGTKDAGKFTCGIKMSKLSNGVFVVEHEVRGQWAAEEREARIRSTAESDGQQVVVYHEQEPGSGGKDSAEATTKNLAGFMVFADKPTGDKVTRADPYAVQVNAGNVKLLRGDWNKGYIEEHRFFPFGKYKDRVDASSGAFTKLALKKDVLVF